jgi:hypothetical protein
MSQGWQGVVVPSKLYGVLSTGAPVLFIGPKDADTVGEIGAYAAGAALPVGCQGEEVVATLETLYKEHPREERLPVHDGPARIAAFISRP